MAVAARPAGVCKDCSHEGDDLRSAPAAGGGARLRRGLAVAVSAVSEGALPPARCASPEVF